MRRSGRGTIGTRSRRVPDRPTGASMPTYEYRCAKCEQHFDVYQSFSEDPLTKHDGCGGKLTKVLSPAGIVLKGSGFYKTDNRSSSSKKSSSSEKKSGDSTSSSTS